MFWTRQYKVQEIYTDIKTEELEQALTDLPFNLGDGDMYEWVAFAIHTANQHGLNQIYTNSMVNVISQFATGMGFSSGTEAYLKEEDIEIIFLDKYNDLNNEDTEETVKFKNLIDFIIRFYITGKVRDFEKAVKRLGIYLPLNEYEQFKNVEGENNRVKLNNLLSKYYD